MNLPGVCNIFEPMIEKDDIEKTYSLMSSSAFELEKIVSYGQITPEGQWYDQGHDEWVMLVKGTAVLRFEDEQQLTLNAGDILTISAHQKHRVEQCSRDAIWLALHINQTIENSSMK